MAVNILAGRSHHPVRKQRNDSHAKSIRRDNGARQLFDDKGLILAVEARAVVHSPLSHIAHLANFPI